MSTAAQEVPRYLGRVLNRSGVPAGTCFQVTPHVLVTALHVLAEVEAGAVDSDVRLDSLIGGAAFSGRVIRTDPAHDIAVVAAEHSLPTSVAGLATTNDVAITTDLLITGVSTVDDPYHRYRYIHAVGSWRGTTERDDNVQLGRLKTSDLVPGMSGAPVRRQLDDVVIGVVSARYNSRDGWLRDSVWVTRTEELAVLLEGIANVTLAVRPLGQLGSQVPDLPRNFVRRDNDLEVLVDTVRSGPAEPVVVHGMSGIGKTVLASAVAHDERVRESFPDGVMWVSLGREANITRDQAFLVEDLGGGSQAFADSEQGRARLKALLAGRSCLVIVDDVWRVEDLEAFDVLGPRCRMVVTTRDARVGVPLAAVDHRLDVLPEGVALELLTKWAGQDIDRDRALEVVEVCGRLPLALAMIGAMVRGRGDRWHNVLHKLRTADLGNIRQHFLGYPYDSLLKALQVSVDALPDTGVRTRYLDFALFLEDIAVPEAVLLTLWSADGLRMDRAQDDIDLLVERSLVQRHADGRLSLHDLLYDYVSVVRTEAGDAQARHGQLIAAYRAQSPQDWPSGPNDGYFFQYLCRHLVAAGQIQELHRLLGLTATDGRHGWYKAKSAIGDVAGFLSDVNTAWRLADINFDSGDDDRAGESMALQLRYALITTSLNSLAGNTPPALLAAALANRVWTAGEVLAYAAHVPDTAQRGVALAAVAPDLPAALVDEALTTANAIPTEADRGGAVASLAARLVALGRIDDGHAAAESLRDPSWSALAFAEMARFRPTTAAEAIRVASQLTSRQERASALARVAQRLADCGLSEAAVEAAQQVQDEDLRWGTLGRLSRYLSQSLVDAAEEHALQTRDPGKRIKALLPLLPRLDEDRAREVLKDIPTMRNKVDRVVAYAAVATCLPESLATNTLDQALALALKIKEKPRRGQAVAESAPYMPEPLVRMAIAR